jgi:hypothetical protein
MHSAMLAKVIRKRATPDVGTKKTNNNEGLSNQFDNKIHFEVAVEGKGE